MSVVVPSFNNVTTITQTLDSILSQEGVDFEVVVSDHHSTDGTWDRLAAYDDPRLKVVRGPADRGAAANWNHATDHATAPLIRLVCADDLLAAGTLARHASLLSTQPESTVMVTGPRGLMTPGGREVRGTRSIRERGLVSGADAIAACARAGTNVLGEPFACTLRTSALRASGGWGSRHGFLLDLESWTRVLAVGDLWVDDRPTGWFRVSSDQWSARLATEQAKAFDDYLCALPAQEWGLDRRDLVTGRLKARLRATARRGVYGVLSISSRKEHR